MPPKPEVRVQIRGQVFPTVRAAAEHFGVCRSRVYEALTRGTIDRVGIGRGKHGNNVSPKAVPFKVGPLHFESRAAASRALGLSRKILLKAERDLPTYHRVLAAAIRYAQDHNIRGGTIK